MKKQKKKKNFGSEIYDHRCRLQSKFFFFLKLLKRHIHLLISLYIFGLVCPRDIPLGCVCVCRMHSRVSQSVGRRGFMSFGVCDDCLVSWIFWTFSSTCASAHPPSTLSDTHDNIQVVKMSPHGAREKNPSQECFWAPLLRRKNKS